jgi:hypothetical protein
MKDSAIDATIQSAVKVTNQKVMKVFISMMLQASCQTVGERNQHVIGNEIGSTEKRYQFMSIVAILVMLGGMI